MKSPMNSAMRPARKVTGRPVGSGSPEEVSPFPFFPFLGILPPKGLYHGS
jgi:hypothetical protein